MVKYALDCDMVGSGSKSLLARVSLVNENGSILIDEYVKPNAPVTDYRTCVSGIKCRHEVLFCACLIKCLHLENGRSFDFVKQLVRNKISGAVIIGHSLHFDLDALGLTHPEQNLRDLAKYKPFLQLNNGQPPSLQFLAQKYLGRYIQEGAHDSVEDAKAAMDIYKRVANEWERLY